MSQPLFVKLLMLSILLELDPAWSCSDRDRDFGAGSLELADPCDLPVTKRYANLPQASLFSLCQRPPCPRQHPRRRKLTSQSQQTSTTAPRDMFISTTRVFSYLTQFHSRAYPALSRNPTLFLCGGGDQAHNNPLAMANLTAP